MAMDRQALLEELQRLRREGAGIASCVWQRARTGDLTGLAGLSPAEAAWALVCGAAVTSSSASASPDGSLDAELC